MRSGVNPDIYFRKFSPVSFSVEPKEILNASEGAAQSTSSDQQCSKHNIRRDDGYIDDFTDALRALEDEKIDHHPCE